MLQTIIDKVVSLIEVLGGPGVGLAVALENLFPPIPSEVILPAAGFAAARGELGVVEVVLWATAGSVVGALALYAIGAWLGRDRLVAIVEKMPLVAVTDVEKAEQFFERHGRSTVLVARLIPVVRSLISIPAGLERMNLLTFTAFTALGSLIWNTLLVSAGYLLGDRWSDVEVWVSRYQYVVIGLVVVALAVWVWRRLRARRLSTEPAA